MRLNKQFLKNNYLVKILLLVLIVGVFTMSTEQAVKADTRLGTDIYAEGKLAYAYDIYTKPMGSKNNKRVRGTKTDYGKLYSLRSYEKVNNKTSYKAYLNGKFQGYIDTRAFITVNALDNVTSLILPSFKSNSRNVYAEGKLACAYDIYNKPIGSKNNKKVRVTKKDYGKTYRIRQVINNSTHTSYKVYLNGVYQGYIDYRALHKINFLDYTNKNITAYGEYKNKKLGTGTYKIEKEIKNDLGSKYHIIKNNQKVLVNQNDISVIYKPGMEQKATGLKQVRNPNGYFYSLPTDGAPLTNQKVSIYQNRYLNVNAKVKVKGETWYRVWVNQHDGKRWTNPVLGWAKESNLKNPNDTTNNFKLAFNVEEKTNQQGLTYNEGVYYIAFDLSNVGYPNHTKIVAYDHNGKKLKETSPLPIGHGAELNYYKGKIYATNGGGEDGAKVFVVDFENNRVDDVIDLSQYGTNGLATIKDDDTIILHTSVDSNKIHTFTIVDMKGNLKKQFTIENAWVPQGLAYNEGVIYFYTNNLITKINENGKVIGQEYLSLKGESEGIEFNKENGKIIIGYNGNNRVYEQK